MCADLLFFVEGVGGSEVEAYVCVCVCVRVPRQYLWCPAPKMLTKEGRKVARQRSTGNRGNPLLLPSFLIFGVRTTTPLDMLEAESFTESPIPSSLSLSLSSSFLAVYVVCIWGESAPLFKAKTRLLRDGLCYLLRFGVFLSSFLPLAPLLD
jgi:hypothetical protein